MGAWNPEGDWGAIALFVLGVGVLVVCAVVMLLWAGAVRLTERVLGPLVPDLGRARQRRLDERAEEDARRQAASQAWRKEKWPELYDPDFRVGKRAATERKREVDDAEAAIRIYQWYAEYPDVDEIPEDVLEDLLSDLYEL